MNLLKKKQPQPEIVLTPEEQQAEWLKKAKYQVKCEHYYMAEELKKKEINLKIVLKHASKMLNELRTSLLTPKNYYSLYMLVFDKIRELQIYFKELATKGQNMSEIYELVQYNSEIVPRLYLIITAGAVYIESKQVRAQNILKDMVELCKGVQHPIRGLFLRHHLSSLTKNLIPDIDTEYGGTITESINYILVNFKETINLFSRLKDTKDKEVEKREKERETLRTLMGTNLIRLSQLEGATKEIYKLRILPAALDVLQKYKDVMAQQFVMECLIQVFPDEYHIETIEELLKVIKNLEKGINLQPIFTSLLDRLANFAQKFPEKIPKDTNMITIFQKYVQPYSEKMNLIDMITVKRSLLKLILEVCPEENKYVSNTLVHLGEQLEINFDKDDERMVDLVTSIVEVPCSRYRDIKVLLELNGMMKIFKMLKFNERRRIAVEIAKTAVDHDNIITEMKHSDTLFEYLTPLLKDEDDYVAPKLEKDFVLGQHLVAKIYQKSRKIFGKGGEKRINYTLPPLVFEYLALSERMFAQKGQKEVNVQKVLQYIIEILNVLADKFPRVSFHLYLNGSICADTCMMEQYVYEFLTQAFLLYEESDSKKQLNLLYLIINSLISLKNISQDNFDTLSTKTCQYAAKLLAKTDQARATVICSHMFFPCKNNNAVLNINKSLECLEWSLKIVNTCMPNRQLPLLVDILGVYLYHFFSANEKVTFSYVSGLIDLIDKDIGNVDEENAKITGQQTASLSRNYELAKGYISYKRKNNPEMFS